MFVLKSNPGNLWSFLSHNLFLSSWFFKLLFGNWHIYYSFIKYEELNTNEFILKYIEIPVESKEDFMQIFEEHDIQYFETKVKTKILLFVIYAFCKIFYLVLIGVVRKYNDYKNYLFTYASVNLQAIK